MSWHIIRNDPFQHRFWAKGSVSFETFYMLLGCEKKRESKGTCFTDDDFLLYIMGSKNYRACKIYLVFLMAGNNYSNCILKYKWRLESFPQLLTLQIKSGPFKL